MYVKSLTPTCTLPRLIIKPLLTVIQLSLIQFKVKPPVDAMDYGHSKSSDGSYEPIKWSLSLIFCSLIVILQELKVRGPVCGALMLRCAVQAL